MFITRKIDAFSLYCFFLEHCGFGQYLSVNNGCLPCEVGTYKNTTSEDVSLDINLRWNCSACKAGQTTIAEKSQTCIGMLINI